MCGKSGKLTGMPTTLRSAIAIASCCACRRRSSKVRQYERVCRWSVPPVQSPTNYSQHARFTFYSSSYYQYHYYYSRETRHTRADVTRRQPPFTPSKTNISNILRPHLHFIISLLLLPISIYKFF